MGADGNMSKAAIALKREKEEKILTIDLTENGKVIDTLSYRPSQALIALAKFAQLEPSLRGRFTPDKTISVILGITNMVDELFGDGTFDYLVLNPGDDDEDINMFDNIILVMEKVMEQSKTAFKFKEKELDQYVLKEATEE